MKTLLALTLATVATIQPLQFDTTTQLNNKVIRGDSFVQFPDGGKIWLCGLMADGTIDARLDAIAKDATLAAIANGADPRDVYLDHRY
jgi:hypothetical protein